MSDAISEADLSAVKEEFKNLKIELQKAEIQRSTLSIEKNKLFKEVDDLKSKKERNSKKLLFYKNKALSNAKENELLVWKIAELKMKMENFDLMKETMTENKLEFEQVKTLQTTSSSNDTRIQELLDKKEVLFERLNKLLREEKKIRSEIDGYSNSIDCA